MNWNVGIAVVLVSMLIIAPVLAAEQKSPEGPSWNDGFGKFFNAIRDRFDQWMVVNHIDICDGKDNDGDGEIDEGDLGAGFKCYTGKRGVCSAGTTRCVDGRITCVQDKQPSPDTQCDRIDQDCDGKADEDYVPQVTSCGTGVCAATGVSACVKGRETDTCKPGKPTGLDDNCNGLDENCDGISDNAYIPTPSYCGTGICGDQGLVTCQNGALVDSCEPRDPSPELCDGVDNDCNGQIDDGNPEGGAPCLTGQLGVCADGTTVCSGGKLVCTRSQEPSEETCNGLDDNCNGQVDDGNPGEGDKCLTGELGICASGETLCTNGALVCTRIQEPSEETCNGLDDNCDGQIDEGLGTTTCGVGECARTVDNCVDGKEEKCKEGNPSDEVCDRKDNDCDGTVDEEFPEIGTPCDTGLQGICAAGTYQCNLNGGTVCAQTNQPGVETCNHLDDNCKGGVDEPLEACSILNEECIETGTDEGYTCSCPAPHFLSCGDACIPISTDDNCGGCGTQCLFGKHCFNTGSVSQPNYVCDFAYCEGSTDQIECGADDICTPINTDDNCGGCGIQCGEGTICRNTGSPYGYNCEVPCSRPNEKMCGTICTDLSTNENCGDCGIICSGGPTCQYNEINRMYECL